MASNTSSKMSSKVIIITGAATGFGAMTARLLAQEGHMVYAGMRVNEHNEKEAALTFAADNKVELRPVIHEALEDNHIKDTVRHVMEEAGRIDIVVHNAAQGSIGPAEAFSPEQIMQFFEINVGGAHRLNRAVLPHMRKAGRGLIVWLSSSSTRGGTPPFLGPYFASKAAMDSLAVSYAGELARWGIETSIIVPGAFTKGTNHFATMGKPVDQGISSEYLDGPYKGITEQTVKGLQAIQPPDADPADVARAIVKVIGIADGKRPFRTHVDPSQDGAEVVNGMADRVRAELLRRIGLEDILKPRM